MVEPAIHLLQMSSGESWEDPSEDGIFEYLSDIDQGREDWIILSLVSDPAGLTYAQSARNNDGTYVVEYQEGSLDRHFSTQCSDMREAHRLLFAWTIDTPGWRDSVTWVQDPPPTKD